MQCVDVPGKLINCQTSTRRKRMQTEKFICISGADATNINITAKFEIVFDRPLKRFAESRTLSRPFPSSHTAPHDRPQGRQPFCSTYSASSRGWTEPDAVRLRHFRSACVLCTSSALNCRLSNHLTICPIRSATCAVERSASRRLCDMEASPSPVPTALIIVTGK